MCDCHPETETPEWRKTWTRVKAEPRTREDWQDLHDTIEAYRQRLIARHTRTEDSDARPQSQR